MICPMCGREFTKYDIIGRGRLLFTPEMARRYVGPVTSGAEVDRYATIMRAGDWDTHMAPLRIWDGGTSMRNGFTRMAALIKAGVSIEFDVQVLKEVNWVARDGKIVSTVHHTETLTEDEVKQQIVKATT